MKLKELKHSMLYTSCTYRNEAVLMGRYKLINNTDQVRPEHDVISFYLAVQVLGEIEHKYGMLEELPNDIAEIAVFHHQIMEGVFFRMFTYILLISVGESRHGSFTDNFKSKVLKSFGTKMVNFVQEIRGGGRSQSRSIFLSKKRSLLDYAMYCECAFIDCFSSSGSYGGEKWKNIACKVTQVLKGEISPYTMVDVSWALVHNTGSIFNKETIYSKDNENDLALLLDVQRGGGIASYILNGSYSEVLTNYLATPFIDEAKKADELLGGVLSEEVTEYDIKVAGALHPHFKSADSTEPLGVCGVVMKPSIALNLGSNKIQLLKRSKS